EDCRTVLRADVAALTILGRGIVCRQEYTQEIAIRDLRRIERDLNCLRMAGRAGADGFIGWVGNAATRVAGLDLLDAAQFRKDRLRTPEAATSHSCSLQILVGARFRL